MPQRYARDLQRNRPLGSFVQNTVFYAGPILRGDDKKTDVDMLIDNESDALTSGEEGEMCAVTLAARQDTGTFFRRVYGSTGDR